MLLAVDLGLAILRPHRVGFREATLASLLYVTVAIVFGVVLGSTAGWDFGGQYLAGYVVEKSLSVDNLFVFVVTMTTFVVPREHQQKVLGIGIVLSLILAFIGVKLGPYWGHLQDDSVPEISTITSLVTTIASLVKARRDPSARAHAGSLRAPRPTDGARHEPPR